MLTASGTLPLLRLHQRTVFTFTDDGRMHHENDPERSRGKRFSVTSCPEGSLAVIRDDVPDEVAAVLRDLVANGVPFWQDREVVPWLTGCLGALGVERPVDDGCLGYLWAFPPECLEVDVEATVVTSGTRAANRIMDNFSEVMAVGLVDRGFREPADLWEPWCAAVVDHRIVSIAQTVRTGPAGAEVGVDTAEGFRGRGLAAMATGAWSRHPELQGLTLFYSTSRENASSRRVTERLGLELIALTFAVP